MAREERLLEEMLRLKLNTTANSMLPPKQVWDPERAVC
jgi:hypothetical protein